MTRNTERRIEIACPVLDEDQKRRIIRFLKIQLADNMKARKQMPNGSYVPIPVREDFAQINSQEYLMEETMTSFAVRGPVPRGIFPKFRLVLNRLWPGVYQENKKF
ncbi:Polyphosphate kinase [bioreactor metagenome]|uniref:Polyphosphate kinase n=1 Tax=bioreactor metagenome TaxID=1076179 RepID=A0A645HUL6_9ZZZZ